MKTKINSTYPCCKGKCQFVCNDVPKEIYQRNCPKCGKFWEITRVGMVKDMLKKQMRIDRLDWSTVELYASSHNKDRR